MPCYTSWDEDLSPKTPEYERAKAEVEAKLKAVRHIVDYYYRAFDFSLPNLPDSVQVDPFRQPRSTHEQELRTMICHHFSCDGVDFCTLYDVASVLDERFKDQRAYLAVILPCASLMRQHKDTFVSSRAL